MALFIFKIIVPRYDLSGDRQWKRIDLKGFFCKREAVGRLAVLV